jgi:hypothetical protein
MRYLMACAIATALGCAPGTEPEDAAPPEEVAIRVRVEVEEPRLVRRQAVPSEAGAAERSPSNLLDEDTLMCTLE